jgi:hypothetical protein
MLKVGDRAEVTVTSAQVFGLFCRVGTDEVLVRIPYVSWIASFASCCQFAEPGDVLSVKITHMDPESGQFSGAIRDLYPDPWASDVLQAGAVHEAIVRRYVPEADRCDGRPAYLLEMLPGAFAMLCASDLSFRPGERCRVLLESVHPERHAVVLAPVDNDSEQAVADQLPARGE